jgi:hypothetical protein
MYVPEHQLAGEETISKVWSCPGPIIAFEFSTGVVFTLEENTLADPQQTWVALAAEDPKATSVGTVLARDSCPSG